MAKAPASPEPTTPEAAPPPTRGVLAFIERLGNKLPDPVFLFIGATAIVIALSALGSLMGWKVQPQQPRVVMTSTTDATGATVTTPKLDASGRPELELKPVGAPIAARSLASGEGIYWLIANMIRNFLNFPPLGVVLVGMFGIGLAEKVGLFGAAMKWIASLVPSKLLTPTVVFLGVVSNVASDAGYIILPPLAATLYIAFGRSPMVGIAAAFAGVSAGFSANLMVAATDALVAGITETGARIIEPSYTVLPTCNWWFMAASTFLLTLVGWGITAWFVEPRLNRMRVGLDGVDVSTESMAAARTITAAEGRGLRWALVGVIAAGGITAAMIAVPGAPLHGSMPAPAPRFGEIPASLAPAAGTFTAADPGASLNSPTVGTAQLPAGYSFESQSGSSAGGARGTFRTDAPITTTGRLVPAPAPQPRWSQGVVPIIFFVFLVPGIAFGVTTGAIRSLSDISKCFIGAMVGMAPVIAMAFFAAQFLECLKFSRLDMMLANVGGQALVQADLPPLVLLIAMILLVMVVNILMSSMSAKWTALAPILVPMMMMVGISPELTQMAYRVGDSVTNVITPLNSYIIVILVAVQRYVPKAGIGNLITVMLPYSIGFFVVWSIFILGWVALGIEPGPGSPLWYTPTGH